MKNDEEIRRLYEDETSAYYAYVKLRAGDHPRRVTETMIKEARDVWVKKLDELRAAGGTAEVLRRIAQPREVKARRRKR